MDSDETVADSGVQMPDSLPASRLDTGGLARYLAATLGRPQGESLRASLLVGGNSNITYRIELGEATWVLRRPPLGHVLATAHDMSREYRLLRALDDTAVPSPKPILLCEDRSVIGAPFLIMEFVPGRPYRFADEMESLGPQRTRVISQRLVDGLVSLYQVDPANVGLGDFGRPQGFLGRQVERWARQLQGSMSRPLPGVDDLLDQLRRSQPEPVLRPAIVHGDYRLDNLLIDGNDEVAAIIDWEMATVGDALTDLALMVTYQSLDRIDPSRQREATGANGFLTAAEQVSRYAAGAGADLSDFAFYLGLAHFKLAAIVESVYFRHAQGLTPSGRGFDDIGHLVEPLARAGIEALRSS